MGKITRRRWSFIAFAVIVVVIITAAIVKKRQDANRITIKTAVVTRGTVSSSVSATGVLEPRTTVEVKSNVGGQLIFLGVDEGSQVKAGEVIAKIDPSDAQSTLNQALADYRGAQAKVAQTQQTLLMQQSQYPTQVDSAKQAVNTAQLKLAQAVKQSGLQKTETESTIDQAQQAVATAKARLAQAEDEARIQPQLTETAIAQAKSNLAAAKATYDQTKTALVPQKIASAQAAVDQAKANLSYAETNLQRQRQLLGKGYVAHSAVDAAEQNYSVTKAQYDTAKNKMDTVKDETQQDLDSAQAKVNQAQAALQSAEANRAQDNIKQRDLDTAKASLKQAEASLKSADANRVQNQLRADDVAVAKASLQQAQASLANITATSYETAIKRGDITQAQAQVQRSQATVTNAQTELGYTTITAPCDGVVIKKYVEKGTVVAAGRSSIGGDSGGSGITLMEIADLSHMYATVNVDETDIAQVKVNQEVDVTVDAYPDEIFTGVVSKIAPETVTEQNVTSIPVTVEIDAPDLRLKPGMNATCDFITDRRTDVLTVPSAVVKASHGESTVMVMKHGKPVATKVQAGLSDDSNTEIVSGLKEGDVIVVSVQDPQQNAASGSTSGATSGNSRSSKGNMRGAGGPPF
ncbi:MAG TPA: efflux RND transporter periplasmic adaptor subunit [Armatimonadota bacterium]|nr:efflux RND transporter periplasmic adaptor subunit [Armatimonadota bacterium]